MTYRYVFRTPVAQTETDRLLDLLRWALLGRRKG